MTTELQTLIENAKALMEAGVPSMQACREAGVDEEIFKNWKELEE